MRVQLNKKAEVPKDRKIKFFIDSGAFSSWRLGKPVNLEKYCDWLLDNLEWIECYASLDVIIPSNPEEAARKSFENLLYMRKRGLDPITIFHVGEPIEYLDRMLDLGCTYMGLSATSITTRASAEDWYEVAWSYLVDKDGDPVVKVHAFGDTRVATLLKFPWYSSDSSSWLSGQRFGHLYMPDGAKLSHAMNKESTRASPDIELLEGFDLEYFDKAMDELGLDKKAFAERQGKTSWIARTFVSAHYFWAMEKQVNAARPIRFRMASGLFTGSHYSERPKADFDRFNLYLAMGSNQSVPATMYAAGFPNPLVSYFYINDKLTKVLKRYAYDPRSVCLEEPYLKHLKVLQEILKDGRIGTI